MRIGFHLIFYLRRVHGWILVTSNSIFSYNFHSFLSILIVAVIILLILLWLLLWHQ